MMLRPKLLLGVPALLAICAPATAQNVAPPIADLGASATAAADGGFQLIEHRTIVAAAREGGADPTVVPSQSVRQDWKLSRTVAAARTGVLAIIKSAEVRHALPIGLLDALVSVESAYQPDVVSRAGAIGLAQLMPRTASALGIPNPFDIAANVDGGARFLKAMMDKFGSIGLALAAYNAGPSAVLRVGGIPANGETPVYVRKVLSAWRALRF